MAYVASGLMNKQVAAEVGLSEVTVKIHRGNAVRKMNAKSLADLVRIAESLGLPCRDEVDPMVGVAIAARLRRAARPGGAVAPPHGKCPNADRAHTTEASVRRRSADNFGPLFNRSGVEQRVPNLECGRLQHTNRTGALVLGDPLSRTGKIATERGSDLQERAVDLERNVRKCGADRASGVG
jgi:hypothetical protein